ncbi:unnamed protein product [Rhodiola kirilowii]
MRVTILRYLFSRLNVFVVYFKVQFGDRWTWLRFRLQGVALAWFNRVLAERSTKQSCLEWEEFKALFLDRFLPESVRDARAREFVMWMQDGMTVTEYANKFTILSAYAPHHVASESTRNKRFIM